MQPTLDPTTRLLLEILYGALLPAVNATAALDRGLHTTVRSTVAELARVLGKPSPLLTRDERRALRGAMIGQHEQAHPYDAHS